MTTPELLECVQDMRKRNIDDLRIVDVVNAIEGVNDRQMDTVIALLCEGKPIATRVALIERSLTGGQS